MNIQEIKSEILNGNLVLIGNKLFSKQQAEQLREANDKVEYFDILQGVKKVQL